MFNKDIETCAIVRDVAIKGCRKINDVKEDASIKR